jgi:N-acetylglucosamine kinase-like BadF-type ATPase
VKDTAAAGDAVAIRILEEAVEELANSVVAVVTRLKLGGDGELF